MKVKEESGKAGLKLLSTFCHKGGVFCISEVIDISPGNVDSSCPSSSLMYSAYKSNRQGENIQSWCTPFPIWNQSVVPCLILTVAAWPAGRFLRRRVRWSDIPIYWRLFQFVVIHTVKGFSVVNEAEIDVFFCNSLTFSMIPWMLAIWSLVPLPFLNLAWTSGSSQFTCLLLLRYTNMTRQDLLMSSSAVTLPSPLHSPCPWPVVNSIRGSK